MAKESWSARPNVECVIWPAMNASVIGEWDMSGGSDPWYMKRIIDYVAYERAHLVFDPDRNYPMGGLNPRPPLFSWSLALGGIFLAWIADMPLAEAVWWSVETQPAIWGALIVLRSNPQQGNWPLLDDPSTPKGVC